MLIEFCTVKKFLASKGDSKVYKFIQVTACKNWYNRPQLD